jgi:hypothetical protein
MDFFLTQITKQHHHIHQYTFEVIKPNPHQPHTTRITTKVSTTNLPPHKHEWKSRINYQKLWLHHKKEKSQPKFLFHWQPNHACYHLLTNYVWPMGFWKILHIKEMQQLVHAYIINHRFTFSEHVETNKKLHQFFFFLSPITTW